MTFSFFFYPGPKWTTARWFYIARPTGLLHYFHQNVSAPCELPLLHGATYEAGYRAGLTVAHASSVNIACEPGRSPPATLNCHLGRLQPTVHDFCRPLGKFNMSFKNFIISCNFMGEYLTLFNAVHLCFL